MRIPTASEFLVERHRSAVGVENESTASVAPLDARIADDIHLELARPERQAEDAPSQRNAATLAVDPDVESRQPANPGANHEQRGQDFETRDDDVEWLQLTQPQRDRAGGRRSERATQELGDARRLGELHRDEPDRRGRSLQDDDAAAPLVVGPADWTGNRLDAHGDGRADDDVALTPEQ